ncbi:hypothetical protein AB0I68_13015 [Streptomyces sp. NPDC050448]|uniref:hypothetical protein n=1 Tax=Streptomyces sp. NPDC050448 TaxID=3155404 RepID=UPI003439938F
MGEHVHIRRPDGMDVSAAGELVETYRCRCGITWTKVYGIEGSQADELPGS